MSDSNQGGLRRRFWTIVGVVALVAGAPLAVIASHSFTDVTDDNQFHDSIDWMQRNSVTFGCNPPDNTEYCPTDNVSRQQMAAFMFRLARTQGTAGVSVTDPADTVTVSGTTFVELASIQATPRDEANVTLNGHVTLTKPTDTDGSYQVIIARDTCDGTVVGAAGWTGAINTEATEEAATVALSATDLITTNSIYVLCAAETVDTSPDATASLRGLNASWQPTT